MKTKISLNEAKQFADFIIEALAPSCQRIEVAGSIRRKKQSVGDIEIVCIPHLNWQLNIFGQAEPQSPNALDLALARLVNSAHFLLLPPIKNGPRYKKFPVAQKPDLYLDLFITTPDKWGVIFAIRTGPASFSKKLVTNQRFGGLLPDEYCINDGRIWSHGQALHTPDERDVFNLIIGKWIEPSERGKMAWAGDR